MRQNFGIREKAEAKLETKPEAGSGFAIGGIFEFECFDKDGNLKWKETIHNLVVNEGLNNILDVYFHNTSQTATWYIGLKGTGAPAAGDTLASHGSWTEFTSYSGDRKEFVENAASSQSIDNSGNPGVFNINGSGTVAGAFLSSVSTGTAGVLFSAVDFSVSRSVDSGDTVNVTYTVSAADDGV
jgi:hypothetical protein